VSKKPFEISRSDGRSNQQVVIDVVTQRKPGDVVSYDELIDALAEDSSTKYTVQSVQAAVRAAQSRLLQEAQRAVHNVRGVGYRVAPAAEHHKLAIHRKRKADVQLKRGVEVLRHVNWSELDDNARRAHEGQLMIMSALYENQRGLDQRMKKVEEVIKGAAKRDGDDSAAA